jgi:dCTP deaminase
MVLTETEIKQGVHHGDIKLELPDHFAPLWSVNSLDLRLGDTLIYYDQKPLDFKDRNPRTMTQKIPESGLILPAGSFFLAHTVEFLGSDKYYISLRGKSSVQRFGLSVCDDAGSGDLGFFGQWTLELKPQIDVRVYPNMPIVQALFYATKGERKMYSGKYSGKQVGAVASKYAYNFKEDKGE